MRCKTKGCDGYADWLVQRPDGRSDKMVCTACRDELVGAYGWHLVYANGRLPDAVPDDEEVDRAATHTRNNLERKLSLLPEDDPSYVTEVAKERGTY